MNEDILIELGSISEETKGTPYGGAEAHGLDKEE